ncbi:MAG: GNAT family protein [Chloroflexota bacterium]
MDVAFDRLLTPRLLLRRFGDADAEALSRYRSDPEVARYQGWDAPFLVEHARAFTAWLAGRHPDEPGEWYQLAIVHREDPDTLVGDCGFRARIEEPGIVDIGFTLDPAVHGRGYATEAVGELLRYLFEDRGKHRLCADCDSRNAPSWRLLERLGFRREGELRQSYCHAGQWADEFLYAILADDWRERQQRAIVAIR